MGAVILDTARNLRKRQTKAESVFWEELRNRKCEGKKFCRQHPIPIDVDGSRRYFIADFYCHELQLVIEIDGGVHDDAYQKGYDEYRTRVLEDMGMAIVRFSNEEVLFHTQKSLRKLKSHLMLRDVEPPLSLEERGRGEFP